MPKPPPYHVARTGANAGKWVECHAKVKCRNGEASGHITYHILSNMHSWRSRETGQRYGIKNVTREDVQRFFALSSEDRQEILKTNQEYWRTLMEEASRVDRRRKPIQRPAFHHNDLTDDPHLFHKDFVQIKQAVQAAGGKLIVGEGSRLDRNNLALANITKYTIVGVTEAQRINFEAMIDDARSKVKLHTIPKSSLTKKQLNNLEQIHARTRSSSVLNKHEENTITVYQTGSNLEVYGPHDLDDQIVKDFLETGKSPYTINYSFGAEVLAVWDARHAAKTQASSPGR